MTDVVVERAGRRTWIRDHRPEIAAAALAIFLVVLLILRWPRAEEEAAAETPVVAATTEVVRVAPFAITVSAIGTVEPQPGAEARVAAPAQTVVTRIHVAEGQIVGAGDPLVELDASVFRARVREAEAGAEAAQRAYDRAQRLVSGGISPRKELEAAEADLARAGAELTDARRVESLSVLRSPIGGVVTSLDAALAQPVDENQPLVQIVNPARMAVLFHLSPADAGRVTRGAEVSLSTPVAGPDPAAALALGEGRVEGSTPRSTRRAGASRSAWSCPRPRACSAWVSPCRAGSRSGCTRRRSWFRERHSFPARRACTSSSWTGRGSRTRRRWSSASARTTTRKSCRG
jgi:multidrug resistance efflux pump